MSLRRTGVNTLIQFLLIGNAVMVLFPILMMGLSAFKSTPELFRNPFGLPEAWSLINFVKVCAHDRLGDTTRANELMERMLSKPEHNYGATLGALLCMKRDKDIVDVIVKRLGSDEQRNEAISTLQIYQRSQHEPPVHSEILDYFEKVRDRPEVKKALEPHGVIRAFPAPRTHWGAM